MAPNPRVAAAFRAMKVLGISEDMVKPVLKNLLKLYDKNWELIEEENYRALADAIFDYQETKEAEQKKKSENIDEEDLEEEAQVHDEPERPLKRLRLKYQEGGTSSRRSNVDGTEVPESCSLQQSDIAESPQLNVGNLRAGSQPISPRPQLRNKGKQPISPKSLAVQEHNDPSLPSATKRTESDSLSPQIRLREKGKEPLSPQIPPREKRLFSERSSHALRFKEPKVEPGIVLLPKKKVPDSHALMKPKDEPFTDDMVQFEVPIAVIPPDPLCQGDSSIGNNSTGKPDALDPPISQCADGGDKGDNVTASSNERPINYELANILEESLPNLEIASSPLGEVKISLSCNSAIGRPDFHMPSLDAVLKLVEDKCLRSYRIIDPNFSVMKLMRDMCESFLELGTESTEESGERSIDVTPTLDSLNKSSTAGDTLGAKGDEESCSMPASHSNGSVNVEVLVPEILRLPPSVNGLDDRRLPEKKTGGIGCGESDEEKELKDDYEKSRSLVVVQQRDLTLDDIRTLYDVNDISKGEERVKISFVNEINSDNPSSFHYIPQSLVFQNAYLNITLARIGDKDCCSTCFGDCLSSSIPCACARETGGEYAYTLEGLVKEKFLEECISTNRDPQQHCQFYCKECPLERSKNDEISEPCKGHLVRKFIKECWSKCGCSKQCGNRLVQRGITCNLQVFLTPEGKGWGLRTLQDLPKGAFVCEYVGEILTNTELYARNTRSTNMHTYPVLLDADWGSEEVLKDEEALCLDATFYGNVARFINHRCLDANLVEIPVEVETPDHHYYHLAFFTTRKVDALEELTWDYGIDFDDHDHHVKSFRCQCGSKFCRNMKRSNRSRSAAVG